MSRGRFSASKSTLIIDPTSKTPLGGANRTPSRCSTGSPRDAWDDIVMFRPFRGAKQAIGLVVHASSSFLIRLLISVT